MANINEILARAAALRNETALNSIDPERAGGIMYDTLLALNELWLQQGAALVISKIYASVAAMNADTSPVSDLTGKPIRPGMVVVIASSDSDNGSVYRYNGTSSPRWSLVGKIGNITPEDSLTSDSTQLPLAAHQGKVLDGKISQLGQKVRGIFCFTDNKELNYFCPNIYTTNPNAKSFGIVRTGENVVAVATYSEPVETASSANQLSRINITDPDEIFYYSGDGELIIAAINVAEISSRLFGNLLPVCFDKKAQYLLNAYDAYLNDITQNERLAELLDVFPKQPGSELINVLSNTEVSGTERNQDAYITPISVPDVFFVKRVKYRSPENTRISVVLAAKNIADATPTILFEQVADVVTGETTVEINSPGFTKGQYDIWYIGLREDGSYNYKQAETGGGWRLRNDEWTPNTNILFNADFYVSNAELKDVSQDLANLEASNVAIEKQSKSGFRYDYMSIYKTTNFSDWLNWVVGSTTDWSVSANGATPTAYSSFVSNERNGVLYLNKRYQSGWKKEVFDVVLYGDTVLDVHFSRAKSTGGTPNESLYRINCAASKLQVMALSGRYVTENVYKSKDFDFTLTSGRKYRCEISMEDCVFRFKLTDLVTTESTLLEFENTWAAGTQKDMYGFGCSAGTFPTITYFEIFEPRNPLVCFLGDSITEGFGLSNFLNRFASVCIRNILKNSVVVAASSNTLNELQACITSELTYTRPKYAIITIGTNNGGASAADYHNLQVALEAIGVIPIFNHIPATSYMDFITLNEKIDENLFNGCYLDVATSIDNVPANGVNTAMFVDGTHPNEFGTRAILSRFISDLQFLFNDELMRYVI